MDAFVGTRVHENSTPRTVVGPGDHQVNPWYLKQEELAKRRTIPDTQAGDKVSPHLRYVYPKQSEKPESQKVRCVPEQDNTQRQSWPYSLIEFGTR